MGKKETIRKKYLIKRKKNYFEVNKFFFDPLIKLIRKKFYKKKISISLYYPTKFELNVMKILNIDCIKKMKILLPIIDENQSMNFYKWSKNEVLFVNKFGVLEPIKSKAKVPNVILLPLLAFDKHKNRIGYGKGYYDRYLNKHLKNDKNLLTIGVAFSFQKHHKLPIKNYDKKLNYIITEKGIF